MPEKDHIFKPSRIYDITLKIKGIDYGGDLKKIRLISSLISSYQIVMIDMFVDPKDILLEGIHGQDHISLSIQLIDTDTQLADLLDLELMFIKNSFEVPISVMMDNDRQKDRSHIQFTAVVRKPFKIMTSLVNKIYGANNDPKTQKEIAEELITEAGGTVEYDTDEENIEKIDQVLIPPTTLQNALKYLDYWFGTHNGSPIQFCQYDGVVHIINLSKRIKKKEVFTVTQLSLDGDNSEIISKANDGKHFYTYDTIQTKHSSNIKFGVLGRLMTFVVKPKDTLFNNITISLDDICSEYGLIDKNDEVLTDDNIDRLKYQITHTGYEDTEFFANSMLAKKISNLSTISVKLQKGLPINELIKVGESVKLDLKTTEHADLSGKYILLSSDLSWNKNADWETVGNLELIRTNKVSA